MEGRDTRADIGWNWMVVYTTRDEWTARLMKAALAGERIRCKLIMSQRGDYLVTVPDIREIEALEVVSRVEMAISEYALERAMEESGRLEEISRFTRSPEPEETYIPKAAPAAVEKMVIASREGVGEIVHYMDHGYELRVGPEPYYMVEESRWGEFTDFSAQRHEFSILLRTEYPNLYRWLKQNKMMGEFIRLVESTYRDVPPPRRRERRETSPEHRRKIIIWTLSAAGAILIMAIIALVVLFLD
ncbi:TPA: hypothetical protein ENG04_09080 [Candidatus Poribacteria bacterium]|nr:hypothetical protein [Candidatus Poribacteria bacterium]HEX30218.1 hypothetical protein [Candidatus Poribacteria bacterium]